MARGLHDLWALAMLGIPQTAFVYAGTPSFSSSPGGEGGYWPKLLYALLGCCIVTISSTVRPMYFLRGWNIASKKTWSRADHSYHSLNAHEKKEQRGTQ